MTSRAYTKSQIINVNGSNNNYQTLHYLLESGNSSIQNGHLVLKPQALTHEVDQALGYRMVPNVQGTVMAPQSASRFRNDRLPPNFNHSVPDAQALARFNGKLRYGSANLGVTLTQWSKSDQMIRKRMKDAQRALDWSHARLSADKKRLRKLRREREPLANQILEGEFGWKPLVTDVHAALTSVVEHAIPDQHLRAVGRESWVRSKTVSAAGFPVQEIQWLGFARTTYAAKVAISNPNLWLANRLGLVNPGLWLWDAIPWSFVVNMFVNVNAMISSLTNEVGLTFSDRNITRSVRMNTLQKDQSANSSGLPATTTRLLWKTRSRSLNSAIMPTWQVRVPDLNWELALIASSLVVQRFNKLNRLIKGI